MPKPPADRPSRRLDAILGTLKRHGIKNFEAAKLDGIGEGLKWTFRPDTPPPPVVRTAIRRAFADPDLAGHDDGDPVDELDLVAQGREGPVPGNGVS